MAYHPVTAKITDLLARAGYWFETFTHEPVRTSEEAAKTRPGYTLAQGEKTIIIRAKVAGQKKFVMLVLPGDKRFSSDLVKKTLGTNDIRFATEEEVGQLTGGVLPGGVPPFGNLFNMEVLADPKLFENEKIVFNAGDRRFSVAMRAEDYRKIVSPRIVAISGLE